MDRHLAILPLVGSAHEPAHHDPPSRGNAVQMRHPFPAGRVMHIDRLAVGRRRAPPSGSRTAPFAMERRRGVATPAPIVQVVADLNDGTRPAGVGVRAQIHTFA